MGDHGFGRTGAFTVGIEEELFLVDAGTRRLADGAEEVLEAIDAPEAAVAHEAYACELELRSPPRGSAPEARDALAELRRAARTAARTTETALLGAGLHPAGELGNVSLVQSERYRRVADDLRGLIRRTPECALHLHVGMPDPEAAIRAFNGLRAHLPLLIALSASSPWWLAHDSGLASARWAAVRAYPGRGVPPAFGSYDEYLARAHAEASAAGVPDYTFLWWDVRPHPRLGTVELRELDAQAILDDAAALAALVQGLAAHEADRTGPWPPAAPIAWSCFRAARDGVAATVIGDGAAVPLGEVAAKAVEAARPHARELGSEDALEGIERILAEGGSAARQRAVHAREGMEGLLEMLVRETEGT